MLTDNLKMAELVAERVSDAGGRVYYVGGFVVILNFTCFRFFENSSK